MFQRLSNKTTEDQKVNDSWFQVKMNEENMKMPEETDLFYQFKGCIFRNGTVHQCSSQSKSSGFF